MSPWKLLPYNKEFSVSETFYKLQKAICLGTLLDNVSIISCVLEYAPALLQQVLGGTSAVTLVFFFKLVLLCVEASD